MPNFIKCFRNIQKYSTCLIVLFKWIIVEVIERSWNIVESPEIYPRLNRISRGLWEVQIVRGRIGSNTRNTLILQWVICSESLIITSQWRAEVCQVGGGESLKHIDTCSEDMWLVFWGCRTFLNRVKRN